MSGIMGTNFTGVHWGEAADRTEVIARARAARDRLSHRGRDFAGDWYDDRFFMGHAEQGGLDSGVVGRLPLATKNAAVTVSLDGHLTNAHELRQSLGKKHAFHGNGGSEVVAQAYLQWGLDEMLAKLRGSFSLAVYDRVNSRLCLARDALGTRPLYYLHEERASGEVGSLMFASELKALEELADKSLLKVDQTAVYDYLTYRYVPAPKTLYQQMRKLSAGQCISFDLADGHSSSQTYWQLPDPDPSHYNTQDAFIERARELLAASVADRLPSAEGARGAKGGPGSGSVAGICQRSSAFATWLSANQPGIRLLSLASDSDGAGSGAGGGDAQQVDFRNLFDEPFADVSFMTRQKLLATLGDGIDCAFSDIGAEVLFGTAARYRQTGGLAPGTLGWFKSKLGGADSEPATDASHAESASRNALGAFNAYTKALGGLTPAQKTRQKAAWELPEDYDDYWHYQQFYRADLPRTLRFQHLDLQTLVPEHQLTQLDRQAARHGVEARVPLLDQDLLVWLLCAPAEFRGPQFNVQNVLLPESDFSNPLLERLKKTIKEASSLGNFLPGGLNGKGGSDDESKDTLLLLRQRFPEFDAT